MKVTSMEPPPCFGTAQWQLGKNETRTIDVSYTTPYPDCRWDITSAPGQLLRFTISNILLPEDTFLKLYSTSFERYYYSVGSNYDHVEWNSVTHVTQISSNLVGDPRLQPKSTGLVRLFATTRVWTPWRARVVVSSEPPTCSGTANIHLGPGEVKQIVFEDVMPFVDCVWQIYSSPSQALQVTVLELGLPKKTFFTLYEGEGLLEVQKWGSMYERVDFGVEKAQIYFFSTATPSNPVSSASVSLLQTVENHQVWRFNLLVESVKLPCAGEERVTLSPGESKSITLQSSTPIKHCSWTIMSAGGERLSIIIEDGGKLLDGQKLVLYSTEAKSSVLAQYEGPSTLESSSFDVSALTRVANASVRTTAAASLTGTGDEVGSWSVSITVTSSPPACYGTAKWYLTQAHRIQIQALQDKLDCVWSLKQQEGQVVVADMFALPSQSDQYFNIQGHELKLGRLALGQEGVEIALSTGCCHQYEGSTDIVLRGIPSQCRGFTSRIIHDSTVMDIDGIFPGLGCTYQLQFTGGEVYSKLTVDSSLRDQDSLQLITGSNTNIPMSNGGVYYLNSEEEARVEIQPSTAAIATNSQGMHVRLNIELLPEPCKGTKSLTVSPGFPAKLSDGSSDGSGYLPNMNCRWLLSSASVDQALKVTFRPLTLGNGDNITLWSGGNIVNTWKGPGAYPETNFVVSARCVSEPALVSVDFMTDGADQNNGWIAEINAESLPCDPATYTLSPIWSTINATGAGSGLRCNTVLRTAAADSAVEVQFLSVDLALSDRIAIVPEGQSCRPPLQTFLAKDIPALLSFGLHLTQQVPVSGQASLGYEVIRTTGASGKQPSGSGIVMRARSIQPFCDLQSELSIVDKPVEQPVNVGDWAQSSEEQYWPGLNCTMTVLAKPGHLLRLRVQEARFTRPGDELEVCNEDAVLVTLSGEITEADKAEYLLPVAASNTPGAIVSYYFRFKTNGTLSTDLGKGWRGTVAQVSPPCPPLAAHAVTIGQKYMISSSTYKDVVVSEWVRCQWVVSAPTNDFVFVSVSNVRLHGSGTLTLTGRTNDGEKEDIITEFTRDAPLTSSWKARYGYVLGGQDTHNEVLVVYEGTGDLNLNQWSMEISSATPPCDVGQTTYYGLLEGDVITLALGSSVQPYWNNIECTWQLQAPAGKRVGFRLTRLSLYPDTDVFEVSSSRRDLLEFGGDTGVTSLSGEIKSKSEDDRLTVHFRSDDSGQSSGWAMKLYVEGYER